MAKPSRTEGSATADGLAAAPGRTIARLAKHVAGAVADTGLSMAQYRVLDFLSHEDAAAAASRLADRLSVSRPTITALVDGLVAKGLVERGPADGDRRRVIHTLTPEGRRTLDAADAAVETRLDALRGHLPPGDADLADRGLALWATALDRAREALLETAEAKG